MSTFSRGTTRLEDETTGRREMGKIDEKRKTGPAQTTKFNRGPEEGRRGRSEDLAKRRSSKENSPQDLRLAGCPVDCLGLTEVVTLVAPRSFRFPPTCDRRISPNSRIICERMFPIPPTKGSSRTPLRATALRLSHLTWSGTSTTRI